MGITGETGATGVTAATIHRFVEHSKGYHDPAEDAAASMELYKLYVEYQDSYSSYALFQARQVLSRHVKCLECWIGY